MTLAPDRIILASQEADMARRRLQKKGHLYRDGHFWRLRWREDIIGSNGEVQRVRRNAIIGVANGKDGLTKKQAEREAWENILGRLDQFAKVPDSMMTLSQFVTQKFEPEHVWALKHAGKEHYKFCLGKIVPVLGHKRLRDIRPSDIQLFIKGLIDAGMSTQTGAHIKNAFSAIFRCAKRIGCYAGENPASLVKLPQVVNAVPSALSFEHGSLVLAYLPPDVRGMALLSMTTSLNVAELCGLRRKRINATDTFAIVDGEAIPPFSIAVQENYYRNRYGTVKTGKRKRIVPIPTEVLGELRAVMSASKFQGPEDPVFPASTGRPIDAHNTNNRLFKSVAKVIKEKHGIQLKVTWHTFRHSCATFAEQVGMERSDRIAMMGHGAGQMTDRYTHSDIERRRSSVDAIAKRLLPKKQETSSVQ